VINVKFPLLSSDFAYVVLLKKKIIKKCLKCQVLETTFAFFKLTQKFDTKSEGDKKRPKCGNYKVACAKLKFTYLHFH
jgi:hypothetical protein